MKISVMMAAYNAQNYIAAALQSILRQTGMSELEIVVIDDGSTDNTATVVSDLATQHPAIKLVRTPNQGVTRARNEAIKALASDTDLISFLDADDLIPAGRYARDIALLQADPTLDVTFGYATMFRQANADNTAPEPGTDTATGRAIQLAAGTFRASTFREVGLFDERFKQAEDMDWLLRFLERGPRYLILDDVCLYYRRHATNMTHNLGELRREFNRALMCSMQRRRQKPCAPFPADFFDPAGFVKSHLW